MPTISTFFGIVIRMHWEDHARPHFHAVYAEQEASYQIFPLRNTKGYISERANRLVREWATLHREELLAEWDALSRHQPTMWINGLE
jgi:hypothetical protein